MIVNTTNEGWEIFSHSAHGLLAGNIANHLAEKFKHENWIATLTAIIEHDDRQLNFEEKNYLTEIGTPLDFLDEHRTTHDILSRSQRLLDEAQKKSTWVAIFIMHHLQFIYSEDAKESKKVSKFLSNLEAKKKNFMSNYKLSSSDVDSIYQIMVFADRCSLIMCQNGIPSLGRKLEINTSIGGKTYFIMQNEAEQVKIEPWIFEPSKFKITCEYKLLEKSSFSSNKQFETELEKSSIRIKEWTLKK